MAKFNFNLREAEATAATPINLVVRWNNTRLVYSTGETIHPKFWEADKGKRNFQRVKETKQYPEYPEFNARLNNIESSAKNAFRKFLNDNDRAPSIEELRRAIQKELNQEPATKGALSLFQFIEKFISEAPERVNDKTGKQFSKSIVQVYKNTFGLLQSFKHYKNIRVDFDTIDLDFYIEFTEYLTKVQGYSTNTIGKHIKTLKTFLNDATERGVNSYLAYKSKRFKIISEQTESIYLNEKELEAIYNIDLSKNTRLERVRDLFIVGCWSGLRFSDFTNITEENIKGDFIELRTQKTAEPVVIPIHSTIKKILKKYKSKYPNSLPPAISNVKMNQYIKEIGEMVECLHIKVSTGITKGGVNVSKNVKKYELITTHTARRSFATNLYLDGVPTITIMKITGHRTERAFLRYIKITPNESAKILQLHWQNKNKLKAV